MSEEIKKLSDYQHARLRNEMYLGARAPHTQEIVEIEGQEIKIKEVTWVPAVFTAFREIFDNALDEVVGHGYGDRINVTYDDKKVFSVEDNGRGIPISWDDEHGCHKATLAMTETKAGRNFSDRGNVAGANGIGASVVNFCSEFFTVDIYRDGQHFTQKFKEGTEEFDSLNIQTPKITPYTGTKTGTKVTFKLSNKVFPDTDLSVEFLKSRITEVAICNPGVKFYFNGEAIKVKPKVEQNLFKDYKSISLEYSGDSTACNFCKFWLVPGLSPDSEHFHSIVNNIPAFNGGVHIDTFRRVFFGNLLTALEKESKKRKLSPNRSDVMDGLFIFNILKMNGPNFDSQSKTRLSNEDIGVAIRKWLDDEDFYKSIIKKNSEWIDKIYERCAERTQKKDAADVARTARKLLRSKVADLDDAVGTDRSKCILFLAEGKSAVSGMVAVRDPEIHGGLPLRGKVLNVFDKSPKEILDNDALASIMNSMGLIPGQKADRKNLRYGKVFIAHDMDPDGLNIGALLINFFYKFWPELFDPKQDPMIHIFKTPFIIAAKGNTRKYWYSHDYHLFNPKEYSGWVITRAKGLGTLVEEDWKYSLKHPETFAIVDDGNMQETLDLIFNNDRADDRKVWIGM